MQKQKGFTLVELVVVVMILGILAAVAAPKLLNTSGAATDNGLSQTLAVVRDAIERHAAENGGALPTDPKTDLQEYLRGPFPTCPVGAKDDEVRIATGNAPLEGDAVPTQAWAYNSTTGEFIVNSAEPTKIDPSITYDAL